jgi:ribosomal protein S18 acetylase RimI-like enzyme
VAAGVFDGPIVTEHTARFLASAEHEMAVALAGDLVVGMASGVAYYHPDKAPQFWINEVGVGDDWLRQGIATKLITAILKRARERGCVYHWLGTETDNLAARALYRKLGGTEETDIVLFDWDDED